MWCDVKESDCYHQLDSLGLSLYHTKVKISQVVKFALKARGKFPKNSSMVHFCMHCNQNYKTSFFQLSLLKALIDRLLQDGMEELLNEISTKKRAKEQRINPDSIITEYTVKLYFNYLFM